MGFSRQIRKNVSNHGTSDVKAGPTKLGYGAKKAIRVTKEQPVDSPALVGLKRIVKRVVARDFTDRENLRVELNLSQKEYVEVLGSLVAEGLLTTEQIDEYLPEKPKPDRQVVTTDRLGRPVYRTEAAPKRKKK